MWGVSLPQLSIDPAHLAEKATMVGVACKARGIIGHLSVDFVTFIDPKEVSVCINIALCVVRHSPKLLYYTAHSSTVGSGP